MNRKPVIAGIGEVLWDVFPDGQRFGGAPANFALHAASLGAESWLVSAVGGDAEGDRALALLAAGGVACGGVAQDPRHRTGRVAVTLDAGGHPSYDIEENAAWDWLEPTPETLALAGRVDALCFGTLGQRSPASRDSIRQLVAASPDSALRIFDVNLRQHFYDAALLHASLEMANAVKLNEDELPIVTRLCGLPCGDAEDMAYALAARFRLRLLVLTRGAGGSILLTPEAMDKYHPEPVQVVDSVGAGDSFTAAVVCGFLKGLPLSVIHQHASAVAGYVCSQRGATPRLPALLCQPAHPVSQLLTS